METAPTPTPSNRAPSGATPVPWRGILLGAAAGALLGAAVGWMYAHRPPDQLRQAQALGPMDYLKVGMAVLATARQIGEIVQRA
ncbi:MAG: hypothetical protein NZ528_06175 [Caldilineales bacterium]|nr:hypothetical protein [Caldilineales bacterium]MDW8317388.1 hypothetical protein [Anaerolineae bacterium]